MKIKVPKVFLFCIMIFFLLSELEQKMSNDTYFFMYYAIVFFKLNIFFIQIGYDNHS